MYVDPHYRVYPQIKRFVKQQARLFDMPICAPLDRFLSVENFFVIPCAAVSPFSFTEPGILDEHNSRMKAF